MLLQKFNDLYLNENGLKKITSYSFSCVKDESILCFDSKKKDWNSLEISLTLPSLSEQKEKTYLFYYDKVWEAEEFYRFRYLVKIILALKKQRSNTILSTSKAFDSLDSFTISRYLSFMLSYLSNHFLIDIDWINSRFILFFYFLTKFKGLNFVSKQKCVFRNLFFIFVFSIYRLKFFFNATSLNLTLSEKYLSSSITYKYLFSQLPKKLFLIQYSPFKVAYSHGFSLLLLKKRKYFFKRLNFIKRYFYSKKIGKIHNKKKRDKIVSNGFFFQAHLKNKLLVFLSRFKVYQKFFKKLIIPKINKTADLKQFSSFFYFKTKKKTNICNTNVPTFFSKNFCVENTNFKSFSRSLKDRSTHLFFFKFFKKLVKFAKILMIRLQNFYSIYYKPRRGRKFFKIISYLFQKILKKCRVTSFLKISLFSLKEFNSRCFYFLPLILGFYRNTMLSTNLFMNFLFSRKKLFRGSEGFFYLKNGKFHMNIPSLYKKILFVFIKSSTTKVEQFIDSRFHKYKRGFKSLMLFNFSQKRGVFQEFKIKKKLFLKKNNAFLQKKGLLFSSFAFSNKLSNSFHFSVLQSIKVLFISVFSRLWNLSLVIVKYFKSRGLVYCFFFLKLVLNFFNIFRYFKNLKIFNAYQILLRLFRLSFFFPLFIDFLGLNKSVFLLFSLKNFSFKMLKERFLLKFKTSSFVDFFFLIRKNYKLNSKLKKNFKQPRLRNLTNSFKTPVQQFLKDLENTKLLDYDPKLFALKFLNKFRFKFFLKKKRFKTRGGISRFFKFFKVQNCRFLKVKQWRVLKKFLYPHYLNFKMTRLLPLQKKKNVKNFSNKFKKFNVLVSKHYNIKRKNKKLHDKKYANKLIYFKLYKKSLQKKIGGKKYRVNKKYSFFYKYGHKTKFENFKMIKKNVKSLKKSQERVKGYKKQVFRFLNSFFFQKKFDTKILKNFRISDFSFPQYFLLGKGKYMPLSRTFFNLNVKKILKISKIKRKFFRFARQYKKRKLSFRAKWRFLRRFFVHSLFFGRFVRNSGIKYDWYQYGTNHIRTLNFHDQRDSFFLHKKTKRFLAISLNSRISPFTQMLSRLSFLNSSLFFNNVILLNCDKKTCTGVKFFSILNSLYFSSAICRNNLFSQKFSFLTINNWLSLLKDFYFINNGYNSINSMGHLFRCNLAEYYTILLFFIKFKTFVFFSEIYLILSEFFSCISFFSKLKSNFKCLHSFLYLDYLLLRLPKNVNKKLIKSHNKNVLFLPFRFLSTLNEKYSSAKFKNVDLKKKNELNFNLNFFFKSTFLPNLNFCLNENSYSRFSYNLSKYNFVTIFSDNYFLKVFLRVYLTLLLRKKLFKFFFFNYFFFLFPKFLFRFTNLNNFFLNSKKKYNNFKKYAIAIPSVGFFTFFYSTFNDKLKFFKRRKLSKIFKNRNFLNTFNLREYNRKLFLHNFRLLFFLKGSIFKERKRRFYIRVKKKRKKTFPISTKMRSYFYLYFQKNLRRLKLVAKAKNNQKDKSLYTFQFGNVSKFLKHLIFLKKLNYKASLFTGFSFNKFKPLLQKGNLNSNLHGLNFFKNIRFLMSNCFFFSSQVRYFSKNLRKRLRNQLRYFIINLANKFCNIKKYYINKNVRQFFLNRFKFLKKNYRKRKLFDKTIGCLMSFTTKRFGEDVQKLEFSFKNSLKKKKKEISFIFDVDSFFPNLRKKNLKNYSTFFSLWLGVNEGSLKNKKNLANVFITTIFSKFVSKLNKTFFNTSKISLKKLSTNFFYLKNRNFQLRKYLLLLNIISFQIKRSIYFSNSFYVKFYSILNNFIFLLFNKFYIIFCLNMLYSRNYTKNILLRIFSLKEDVKLFLNILFKNSGNFLKIVSTCLLLVFFNFGFFTFFRKILLRTKASSSIFVLSLLFFFNFKNFNKVLLREFFVNLILNQKIFRFQKVNSIFFWLFQFMLFYMFSKTSCLEISRKTSQNFFEMLTKFFTPKFSYYIIKQRFFLLFLDLKQQKYFKYSLKSYLTILYLFFSKIFLYILMVLKYFQKDVLSFPAFKTMYSFVFSLFSDSYFCFNKINLKKNVSFKKLDKGSFLSFQQNYFLKNNLKNFKKIKYILNQRFKKSKKLKNLKKNKFLKLISVKRNLRKLYKDLVSLKRRRYLPKKYYKKLLKLEDLDKIKKWPFLSFVSFYILRRFFRRGSKILSNFLGIRNWIKLNIKAFNAKASFHLKERFKKLRTQLKSVKQLALYKTPAFFKKFNRVRNIFRSSTNTKFQFILKKKVLLDCFFSPKFLNILFFLEPKDLVFVYKSYIWLDRKYSLIFRLNKFVEFLLYVLLRYKNKNQLYKLFFFKFFIGLYRKSKQLLRRFFKQMTRFFIIFKRRKVSLEGKGYDYFKFYLRNLYFSFFYNFFSTKFLKNFLLRFYFPADYIKFRFRFINRYLWFRVLLINNIVKKPKIFVIITKMKNNFFLTGIDLFGRILYKCSPGMVGYTGTDRMSKYAWYDASVDFFGGLIEFTRYFLKRRIRRRLSFVGAQIRYLPLSRMSKVKFLKGKPKVLLSKSKNYMRYLKRKKRILIFKKRRRKFLRTLRTHLRRFYVISKGASQFNLRIVLKAMKEYRHLKVNKYFSGSIIYPLRSFSLCRIKKVRRI